MSVGFRQNALSGGDVSEEPSRSFGISPTLSTGGFAALISSGTIKNAVAFTRIMVLGSIALCLSHARKDLGRLPALGSRDTIGDHLVSVVRHSRPFDMKFEITAGKRLNFDFASVPLHFFYLFVGPSAGMLRLGYILEAHAP